MTLNDDKLLYITVEME